MLRKPLTTVGRIPQPATKKLRRVDGPVVDEPGRADRRQRLLYATDKGRKFFEVLSSTQTSRIDAAIAALPPDGKRTVLKFFVGMVEPGDRPTLDRLKLTEDI